MRALVSSLFLRPTAARAMGGSPTACETSASFKALKDVLPQPSAHWVGDGFNVVPVFSSLAFTPAVSPFLMLDYAFPKNFSPTNRRRGVGQHPHRGFETVTIAFQGEVEHADSFGHQDVIGPGDVQWMTAARGIVHEEFISTNLLRTGGVLEMMQLWVNLPAKHKLDPPRYQAIHKEQIPRVPFEGGQVRVIAGDYQGNKGPAKTFTPIELWDVRFEEEGKTWDFELPAGHKLMVFVRTGAVAFGDDNRAVGKGRLAMLGDDARRTLIVAKEKDSSVVVLAGEPINEPIAARGPFVMNTQRELMQAVEDFHAGKFASS